MRKVVEKKGSTYEEAVGLALAELGIPRERAEVVLLQARDTDRRRPGPEEYYVRAWEKDPAEAAAPAPSPDALNVPPPPRVMCEKTAPTMEEAVQSCLDELGISEDEADIQVLQREDTNPLRPGPERITVRVWRRRTVEPAPTPGSAGSETIQAVRVSAPLPTAEDIDIEASGRGADAPIADPPFTRDDFGVRNESPASSGPASSDPGASTEEIR